MRTLSIALLYCILAAPLTLHAEFVVSHLPSDLHSGHENYNNALLQLALEKTRPTYGDYKLVEIPFYELRRREFVLAQNHYPNLIIELAYDQELTASNKLSFINFPVELGVVGHRICFVNPAKKVEIAQASSLKDLRQYVIGQGAAWSDTKILRHNGFKVIEVQELESLFKMTAASRIDLYCRGISELKNELNDHKNISSLTVDESFMLVYPLPRFFYLNEKNNLAKQRIETGLKLAYADGSLKKLLLEHYQSSFAFAHIKKRKIFRLENPLLQNLPEDYRKYLINMIGD